MIRALQKSDVAPLTEIYNHYVRTSAATFETNELTEEQMCARLFGSFPDYPCVVAEEDGKVLGYCAVHPWRQRFDNVAEVTMYISPESRSRGLGKLMLSRIIDLSKGINGLNGLIACINANNEQSKAILERFGFVLAGHYRRVARKFNHWLDDMDFQLLF